MHSKTSQEKSRFLEDIVAKLHVSPGIKIEKRVKLSPISGSGGKREIDILITANNAGYQTRLAIECKNEKKPIEADYIQSFIAKLVYLGIPYQNGIFISTSPYRKGAIELANYFRMRLLRFKGLTSDGLTVSVYSAFQSIVHLLLTVKDYSFDDNSFSSDSNLFFFDEDDNFCATVYDLIWLMWQNKKIPLEIGECIIEVNIPTTWICKINEQVVTIAALLVRIHIQGILFTFKGSATNFLLENAVNNQTEKLLVNTQFENNYKNEPIIIVSTEEELKNIYQSALVRVFTGRYPFPKIQIITRYGLVFWPPSSRVAKQMVGLIEAYGDKPELQICIPPTYVQSDVIDTMWEPIDEGYWHMGSDGIVQ